MSERTRSASASTYPVSARNLAQSDPTLTDVSAFLRERESRPRALMRAIPDVIVRLNREGAYLGYVQGENAEPVVPSHDCLGKRAHDVLPEDLAARLVGFVNLTLKTGKLQQFDYEIGTDSGVRHFEARFVPDDHETVLAVIRDITERKRVARALEQSEARYRALYDNIPLMYFTLSIDGVVLSVNAVGAQQLGYTRAELIGEPVLQVFHPDDREAVQQQLARAVRRPGEVARWEFRKNRKDGTVIWVREAVTTVKHANNQTVVLVVCEDITEQRETQEKLALHREQLERLSSELVMAGERERRSVARELHDGIGQLLGLARGKLGKLSKVIDAPDGLDPDEVCTLLDYAIEQTRSLTRELSSPVLQELGLVAALETLGERMTAEGGFAVHVVNDSPVQPESENLGLILFRTGRELLMNVVKHASAKNVWVELNQVDHQITLAVRDDGRGFDTERLHLDISKTKTFGLFSARQHVEHAGGTFSIESTMGQGTCVSVTLPVVGNSSTHMEHGL